MKFALLIDTFVIFAISSAFGRRTEKKEELDFFREKNSISGRDLIQEAKNKEVVTKYCLQVFGQRDLHGIEKFFGPSYTQHNPLIEDGVQGLISYLNSIFPPGTPPNPRYTIERIIADGDLVWVHALTNLESIPNSRTDQIIASIYRLQNGLLVEHFSVLQDVPSWSINPHPMVNVLEKEYQPKCAFSRTPPK